MSAVVSLTQIQKKCSPAKVLAVSKLQSPQKIRQLYDQGQRLFAENYVQELNEKLVTLADLKDIEWHFIGRLQSNKVKNVVGKVDLIHSVDSISLLQKINSCAEASKLQQKILLQVNVSGEVTKGGFDKNTLVATWPEILKMQNICVVGLMTMPPLDEDSEKVRPFFKELKSILSLVNQTTPTSSQLHELSMGTSGDYEVALQEGATIVRLGTILFGERATKS